MLRVRRLGLVSYAEAFDLQHALARAARDDYLLLLEHPHVYTLGVHADRAHVLDDPASVGASLFVSDRGGDVTYHGPGQLVVYPVVTLEHGGIGAGPGHVRRVEQLVIDSLADVGIRAARLEGYPGVWTGVHEGAPKKIAAIGVRTIRVADGRRRTLHGIALNVDPDLEMFTHIVPCGISDLPVTSVRAEGSSATMEALAEAIVGRATRLWGARGVESQRVTSPVRRVRGLSVSQSAGPIERGDGGAEDRAHDEAGERPLIRRLRQAGGDPEGSLPLSARKPPWLRVKARMGDEFLSLGRTIHDLGLSTVCEEAGCPNIFECWGEGTATFMVNGSRCTRACGFCLVDTRHPLALDEGEPERVAEAVDRMALAHAVVTCVARDDLDDGGAGAIAKTVEAIRARRPGTTVEVLVSDFKGDAASLDKVLSVGPDVLNHNVETVARLQRAVRPSAGYARSLTVLARASAAGLLVKSGLMVGLGEREDEVVAVLADMAGVGVSIATIGQYLRPSAAHLPVARWWTPEELDALGAEGRSLGIAHVEASPLTRSSYHARRAVDAVQEPSGARGHVLRPRAAVPVAQGVGSTARVG